MAMDQRNAVRDFNSAWPAIDAIPGWLSPGQERCLFDVVARLPDEARILRDRVFSRALDGLDGKRLSRHA